MTRNSDSSSTGDNIPDDHTITVPESHDYESDQQYIGEKLASLFRDYINKWSSENPFIIHAKVVQGSGKTVIGINTLALSYNPTAVFGPRHENVKEDTDKMPLSGKFDLHVEGKDTACEHSKYKGMHASVPQDLSRAWCKGCKHRSRCSHINNYRRLINKPQNFTAVHQHLLHLPKIIDCWDDFETVVIDESPWDTIVEQTETLSPADIKQEENTIEKLQEKDQDSVPNSLLETVHDAMSELEDAAEQREKLETFSTWEEARQECVDQDKKDTLITQLAKVQTDQQRTEHENVVSTIFKALPYIQEAWERLEDENRHLPIESPPEAFWKVTDDGYLQLRWMQKEKLRDVAAEKPTVVLATEMAPEVVEAIFDLPVVTISDDHQPAVDTLQLGTQTAGITTLKEKGQLWDNLLELTELAIKRELYTGTKTFVAVKKALKGDVRDYLTSQGFTKGEDFEIGNYFGLTGSNRFQDCDAVVLFGNARLRDEDARAKELLTGVDREKFHYDKMAGELRDALHRTRPTQKDGIRAYILTDAVDFEEDFDGEYNTPPVDNFRNKLKDTIKREKDKKEIRDAILQFVREREEPPTATEFKELEKSYTKVKSQRENLVEVGKLQMKKETGGSGPPVRKYYLSDAVDA